MLDLSITKESLILKILMAQELLLLRHRSLPTKNGNTFKPLIYLDQRVPNNFHNMSSQTLWNFKILHVHNNTKWAGVFVLWSNKTWLPWQLSKECSYYSTGHVRRNSQKSMEGCKVHRKENGLLLSIPCDIQSD